eukprot:10973691-Karenia_brevis.AAC.1
MVNLAFVEHMMRRAQLIGYYHRERLRQEVASSSTKPVIDHEEAQIFTGAQGTDSAIMVCPALM